MTPQTLCATLEELWQRQLDAVALWHGSEAWELPGEGIIPLGLRQHRCNFDLWHVEDRARRRDVTDAAIAACKREIDTLNQQRNDLMEALDRLLAEVIQGFPGQHGIDAHTPGHTETLGAVVDRMSVLSLKIYHMGEEAQRQEAGPEHVARCSQRLEVLWRQHGELRQAVRAAIEDYAAGRRRPRVYLQCKMYNDPNLNPELYRRIPTHT